MQAFGLQRFSFVSVTGIDITNFLTVSICIDLCVGSISGHVILSRTNDPPPWARLRNKRHPNAGLIIKSLDIVCTPTKMLDRLLRCLGIVGRVTHSCLCLQFFVKSSKFNWRDTNVPPWKNSTRIRIRTQVEKTVLLHQELWKLTATWARMKQRDWSNSGFKSKVFDWIFEQ